MRSSNNNNESFTIIAQSDYRSFSRIFVKSIMKLIRMQCVTRLCSHRVVNSWFILYFLLFWRAAPVISVYSILLFLLSSSSLSRIRSFKYHFRFNQSQNPFCHYTSHELVLLSFHWSPSRRAHRLFHPLVYRTISLTNLQRAFKHSPSGRISPAVLNFHFIAISYQLVLLHVILNFKKI